MFMGGVDRTDQIRKTYGFDRKSKRFCSISLSSSLTMPSIMLTHFTSIAGKVIMLGQRMLSFRLELVNLLLKEVGLRKGM